MWDFNVIFKWKTNSSFSIDESFSHFKKIKQGSLNTTTSCVCNFCNFHFLDRFFFEMNPTIFSGLNTILRKSVEWMSVQDRIKDFIK